MKLNFDQRKLKKSNPYDLILKNINPIIVELNEVNWKVDVMSSLVVFPKNQHQLMHVNKVYEHENNKKKKKKN